MNGLKQYRLTLRQALGDADTARGAECHVRPIDGRIRAVDKSNAEIDHGKAQRTVLERVDDALLDRGNVVSRPHTAGDPFLERKSRAARQRLDLEHDVTVLAVAAGLFLVPAALGDGF